MQAAALSIPPSPKLRSRREHNEFSLKDGGSGCSVELHPSALSDACPTAHPEAVWAPVVPGVMVLLLFVVPVSACFSRAQLLVFQLGEADVLLARLLLQLQVSWFSCCAL